MPQSAVSGSQPTSINQIGDVSAGTPSVGDILKWNGAEWALADDLVGSGQAIPQVIDDLLDVSTSGVDAPQVGEFLGWDGAQWWPATPEGEGGPQVYASGRLNTISTTSASYVAVQGMLLIVPSGHYHALYSSSAQADKNNALVTASIFVNDALEEESTREIGGQANNRGNLNSQALFVAPTGAIVQVRWFVAGGATPTAQLFKRLLIVKQVTIESMGV
jgi:hypothetical protein